MPDRPRLLLASFTLAQTNTTPKPQFDVVDIKLNTYDGTIHAACKSMTMADLARMLPSFAPVYVDRQVLDSTGIKGSYDFKLDWVGKPVADQQGGMTLPADLEKELGLRLEERRQPMPVLVIDHIERPSEN